MSYAVVVRGRAQCLGWSQAPLVALIIAIAAYGPLLQSSQVWRQVLPTAGLQQLRGGGTSALP